jgi:hypothetical protein
MSLVFTMLIVKTAETTSRWKRRHDPLVSHGGMVVGGNIIIAIPARLGTPGKLDDWQSMLKEKWELANLQWTIPASTMQE